MTTEESTMQITTAQRDTLRRIRSHRDGQYEIAATEVRPDGFGDHLLIAYFDKTRVSIRPDGSFHSEHYGTHQFGRFGTAIVERPVDHLTASL